MGTRIFERGTHRRRGPLALVCGALLLGASLAGCAPSSGPGGSVLAASVDGHGITLAEYQGLLNVYKTSSIDSAQQQGQALAFAWQSANGRPQMSSASAATMQFLVDYELANEMLKKPISQKDYQTAYKQLVGQRAQLEKNAATDPAAKAFAQSLTPDVLHVLADQTAVTQAAMASAEVPTAHLRIILVKSKAQATSLQKQAEQGKDFGQLAHDNNTDKSLASSNGDLPSATYYVGQLASGTSAQQIDAAIAGKGAHSGKYAIVDVSGQWALIEITQRANKKLSDLKDPTSEQTVFNAYLSNIVLPAAHVNKYITLS